MKEDIICKNICQILFHDVEVTILNNDKNETVTLSSVESLRDNIESTISRFIIEGYREGEFEDNLGDEEFSISWRILFFTQYLNNETDKILDEVNKKGLSSVENFGDKSFEFVDDLVNEDLSYLPKEHLYAYFLGRLQEVRNLRYYP